MSDVVFVDCTDSREGCLPYHQPIRYDWHGMYTDRVYVPPQPKEQGNAFTISCDLPTDSYVKQILESFLERGIVGSWEITMLNGKQITGSINDDIRSQMHVGNEHIEFSANPNLCMKNLVQLVRDKGKDAPTFWGRIKEWKLYTRSRPGPNTPPELTIRRPEKKPGEDGCVEFIRMVDVRYIGFKGYRIPDNI